MQCDSPSPNIDKDGQREYDSLPGNNSTTQVAEAGEHECSIT